MKNLFPLLLLLLPTFFACQKEEPLLTLEFPSSYDFKELSFGESQYFTFDNGNRIEIGATGSFSDFDRILKEETLEEEDFWQTERITLLSNSELQIEYNSNSIAGDTTIGYFLRDQEVVIETGVSWFPEIVYELNSDFTQLSFCYETVHSPRSINPDIWQGNWTTQPCQNLNPEERIEEIFNSANEPFVDTDTVAINFSHFVFSKE